MAPVDLRKLVRQAGQQKELAVSLHPLCHSDNFVNEFVDFHFHCKKQISNINQKVISLEDAFKKGYPIKLETHAQFDTGGDNERAKELALEYLTTHFTYPYVEIKNELTGEPIHIPIGEEQFCFSPAIEVTGEVSIKGVQYFDKYYASINADGKGLFIDGFFHILRHNDGSAHINATIEDNRLSARIKHLRFLSDFFKYNEITLGNQTISVNKPNWSSKDSPEQILELWQGLQDILDKLGCKIDPIISDFAEEDFECLSTLHRSLNLHYGFTLKEEYPNHRIYMMLKLGRYRFIMAVNKNEDGLYVLENAFDDIEKLKFNYVGDNGQTCIVPIFSLLFREPEFESIVNISYTHFIDVYENTAKLSPHIYEQANLDVLSLLSIYDRQTCKNSAILDRAMSLIKWTINNSSDAKSKDIYKINELQIKRRQQLAFSEDDFIRLNQIMGSTATPMIKWGAAILLGKWEIVKCLYNEMSEDDQKTCNEFPIATLIPDCKQ